MTALVILDSHKENLRLLHNQPPNVLADFCKLSSSFLTSGSNMKLYINASQKLQANVKQVQTCIEGLAYLFVEARKHDLKEDEFRKVIIDLGFPESFFSPIFEEYLRVKNLLNSVLPDVGIQHYQFNNLEWRFEAELSSRSMLRQIKPRVIMKLELKKKCGETKNICLQSDIPNLIHMSQELNIALHQSETNHSKRILHAIT